jgi:SAM-dependent methyltransferase
MIKVDKNNPNKVDYWNLRYQSKNWEEMKGKLQTEYWANLILENLPEDVVSNIKEEKLSIADVGCALGQLTSIFAKKFPKSNIDGIDFSDVAARMATELYPSLDFIEGKLNDNYDCVVVSNVLEHDDDYMQTIKEHLKFVDKYYIVLSPFNESAEKIVSEHVVVFDSQNDFPEEIDGFNRIFIKEIDVRSSGFWHGDMILVIYEKKVEEKIEEEIKIKVEEEVKQEVTKKKFGRPKKTKK